MLLRDSDVGVEVLLLRRGTGAPFVGGSYVFPGGLVDATDHPGAMASFCGHLDDNRASELLGIERGGLAFWVAAIRESFEEAGILMARRRDTIDPTSPFDILTTNAADLGRRRSISFADMCAANDLVLLTDWLHPVSRWISPATANPRYDTWFFVARVPAGQVVDHDPVEMTASRWIRPHDALHFPHPAELPLTIPTRRNLELLDGHATVDAALQAIRSARLEETVRTTPRSPRRGWR